MAAGYRRCSSSSGGEALRERIDRMPNEEYQRLLRLLLRWSAQAASPVATGAIERVTADLDATTRPRVRSATSAATTSRR